MTQTKLGIRWKACFLAILLVSPYLLLVAFYIKFQDQTDLFYILTLMLVYGLPGYTLFSLIAWLFVGMPMHHLIQRFSNSGAQHYLVSSLLLCILVYLYGGYFAIILIGTPMVMQSLIFCFYWNKFSVIK